MHIAVHCLVRIKPHTPAVLPPDPPPAHLAMQERVLAACRTLAKLAAPSHFEEWQDVLLGADIEFLRTFLSATDLAVASEHAR